MTEKELLDLLTDVRPDYIAQTEAFRRGSAKPRGRRHKGRLLPVAAMLAVVLAAGALVVSYLAPNWKKGAEAAQAETMAAAAKSEDLGISGWQEEILNGGVFYSQAYEKEMTVSSYTEASQELRETDRFGLWRYAILDMDGNGTQELVLQYRMETDSYFYGEEETLVFWKVEEKILERSYYTRQMQGIRADGAFYWSGSSSEHGWARLTGLDGNDPGSVDIPEDQWDQPEPEWHSFDGGDEHSRFGPSADDLLRFKQWQIHYVDAEGNETALWADLFIGDGYSIYIPQTGWAYRQTDYNGIPADEWHYEKNNDIWMLIFKTGGDVEDARNMIRETEGDWSFFPDKQGNLYAERDGKVMNVCFVKAEVDIFVIMWTHPMEAYEGAGQMISILSDTFDRWPRGVNTWYPKGE